MKPSQIEKRINSVCVAKNFSKNTANAYTSWILRFAAYCSQPYNEAKTSQEKACGFLTAIAESSAFSTQNQALNAIVFFYREVIKEPIGEIGEFANAKRPTRLPTVLSKQEAIRLFAQMSGLTKLMAELCYGGGFRLMELMSLRVKDIDFDSRIITIRQGKGAKDRSTLLPASLVFPLQQQLQAARRIHELDRKNEEPGVYMPDNLGKKYPAQANAWGWFWVFPAARLGKDPETGTIRRHHIHKNTLQKAIRTATPKAEITKHVKVHTLRHSFATHLLMDKVDIRIIQKLMGHKDIETTAQYLHCIPNFAQSTQSPLETLGNVVQFPTTQFNQNSQQKTS